MSRRFQSYNFDQVFQVVEIHGGDGSDARAYTLCDLRGSRELGFSQPVSVDRLTAVEVLPLAQISEDQPTRLQVDINGTYHTGTLRGQSADGKVHIRFDDRDEIQVYDLATCKYRWLP